MTRPMDAIVRQVEGLSLIGKASSGHWVPMDGGSDAASSPLELVLQGLAGCTAVDVLGMLVKMRARIDDFAVEAHAERSDEHPKVFTKVELVYRVRGDVRPQQLERAIALSHGTYCSVSAMLKPGVAIEHRYEIEASTEPATTDD